MPLGFMPAMLAASPAGNRLATNKRAALSGGSFFSLCGLVIRHRRRGRGRLLFRDVRNKRLGRQQHGGDAGRILQRRAGDLGRVHDAGLDHVSVFALVGVEALALWQVPHLLHHDGSFPAGVVDDLTKRLLERAADQRNAGCLVARKLEAVERALRVHQHGAATGHDALLDGGPGGRHGVLHPVLLLLELGFGWGANLDDGDATGQLGQPLLELFLVPVRGRLLDLGLDLVDAPLDRVRLPGAFDDRRIVLGDRHAPRLAQLVELHRVEFEAELLGDHLATGQDGDVLEHGLAAIAEARRLDGDGGEGTAQLVDDDGGLRLALDVLGDDQERLAALAHLLAHRPEVGVALDLLVGDQDEGILQDRLHAGRVGHHVGRDVALVELHAVDELQIVLDAARLFDGDDAVLPNLLHRIGDHVTDFGIAGRDGCHLGDLLAIGDLNRLFLDGLDDFVDGLLDADFQEHRVGAGGHVTQPLADDRRRQHDRGGGAVTGDVIRFACDFLDELGPHVLEGILQLDLLRNRHAVVGDCRGTELLVEYDVTAFGADGNSNRVSDFVDAALQRGTGVGIVTQLLRHCSSSFLLVMCGQRASIYEAVATGHFSTP